MCVCTLSNYPNPFPSACDKAASRLNVTTIFSARRKATSVRQTDSQKHTLRRREDSAEEYFTPKLEEMTQDMFKTFLTLLIFIPTRVKLRGKTLTLSVFSQLFFHFSLFLLNFKHHFCMFSEHPQQAHPAYFQGYQSCAFISQAPPHSPTPQTPAQALSPSNIHGQMP